MHKNPFFKSGLALVLGLGIGLSAQADDSVARLSQFTGKVWVNTGKTSVPAQTGMPLARGYRILIPADGSAQVVYKDGCALPLGPNSLLTIEGKNQCSEGAIVAQLNPGVRLAQAGGGPVGGVSATAAGLPEWVPAAIAGAGIAGIVAIGATSGGGGGGGNNQISPE